MSKHLEAERVKAIEYLKSRRKYLGSLGCKFKPTSAASTNVAETFKHFVEERANESRDEGKGRKRDTRVVKLCG
jgi:hypothetical protein